MFNRIFILSLIGLSLIGCKEDVIVQNPAKNQYLKINVTPLYQGSEVLSTTTFTTTEGYDVQLTELKFFFSHIKNGDVELAQSALYDWSNNSKLLLLSSGEVESFGSISANLGISDDLNHNDPSAFPTESPLNILNASDMHWSWNPGYIFVKFEAKVDTLQDGQPLFDHNVSLHVGKDENLKQVVFNNLQWVKESATTNTLNLSFNIDKFLQNGTSTIDLKNEFWTHTAPGEEILSAKAIENFKAALEVL